MLSFCKVQKETEQFVNAAKSVVTEVNDFPYIYIITTVNIPYNYKQIIIVREEHFHSVLKYWSEVHNASVVLQSSDNVQTAESALILANICAEVDNKLSRNVTFNKQQPFPAFVVIITASEIKQS